MNNIKSSTGEIVMYQKDITNAKFAYMGHDRFLIIDDVVYLFRASLKDAGKKLFAYINLFLS
jgi:hypothetical protein